MWRITIDDINGDEIFSEHTTGMVDMNSCVEHIEQLNLLRETDGCGNPLILSASEGCIWEDNNLVTTLLLPIQDDTWSTVLVTISDGEGNVLESIQVYGEERADHLLGHRIVERLNYTYPILRDC